VLSCWPMRGKRTNRSPSTCTREGPGYFAEGRLAGLHDSERPGKPAKYDQRTERRVLRLLDQAPPQGYSQWNGRRLAEALGDVSKDQVWRILRRHDICLQRRRSWCISTGPEFGPKAADVVGLYLNPPANALIREGALAHARRRSHWRWDRDNRGESSVSGCS
jgi:transposase